MEKLHLWKIYRNSAVLLFFLLLIFVNIKLYHYAEDDAYIHFRISEHLVQYRQPYYNVGEPVFATSSPVWTLFLAGVTIIPISIPPTVAILNAFFVGIGALIYARISYDSTGNRFLLWIIPLLYAGILLRSSIGLMETPLAMLVVGWGIYLYLKRSPLSFFLLSLGIFIRLELAILFIILLVTTAYRKNILWKPAIYYSAAGSVPFLIFDVLFFQTIIPNTVAAKSIVYQLSSIQRLKELILTTLPNLIVFQSLIPLWQIIYLTSITALSGIVILFIIRKWGPKNDRFFINYLLFMAGILIVATYMARGVLIFPWYIPIFLVPIIIGLSGIYGSSASLLGVLFVIFFSAPFCLNLVQTSIAAMGNPEFYDGFDTGARVRSYLEIGKYLYQAYPNAVMMTSEIGGLGFTFKGNVKDAAGLVSPAALRFHPMKVPEERSSGEIGAIPIGYIREIKPDVIVGYDIFLEAFLRSNISNDYERVRKPIFLVEDMAHYSSNVFWNSNNLNIFYRKDFLLGSYNTNGAFYNSIKLDQKPPSASQP